MRTNQNFTSFVSPLVLVMLMAGAVPSTAQERVTTPQTDEFVEHPTYCHQWIGGVEYSNESVSSAMVSHLVAAVTSLKNLSALESMSEISEMCRVKISAGSSKKKMEGVS